MSMRKLIVITLALMVFGVYESKRPQKVGIKTDISERCKEIMDQIRVIREDLEKMEKTVTQVD